MISDLPLGACHPLNYVVNWLIYWKYNLLSVFQMGKPKIQRALSANEHQTTRCACCTNNCERFVHGVVQSPEVRGPVSMAEASLEREEPGNDLRQLALQERKRMKKKSL